MCHLHPLNRHFQEIMAAQAPFCKTSTLGDADVRAFLSPTLCSGKKKSTKIYFLGLETARWNRGLPREGVVAEKFGFSLESLSSLGFERRNLGCPGNFAGMSRPPGDVQKVCAKKVRARFSFPICRILSQDFSSCYRAPGPQKAF